MTPGNSASTVLPAGMTFLPGTVITPTSAAHGGSPGYTVPPSNMTFPPVTVNAPFSDGTYMLTNPSRVTYQPGALTTPFSMMPQNSSFTPHTNLPKLTIKKFDGDLTKWSTFWDSFDSAIHINPKSLSHRQVLTF